MSENGDDLFFTEAQIKEIKVLEDALSKAGQDLRAQDKKDGFAIQARKAFIRFRSANQDNNKYADFAPSVLGREGEKFDEVWDYTYWKPFIVYVEKAPGRTAAELRKDFATKANLLSRLAEWFKKNLKEKFDLKRVLPLDGDTVIRDGPLAGKKFATAGELAEAEGWPLEVNVLKDGQTFQLFLEAKMGGAIPGARAFYSNTLKHVVTWDDPRAVENDDQAWFNESVLIHECFHMLSDHYAAKPIPWDFKKERDSEGVRRKVFFPKEERARYYNLLIQEGLTDSIAASPRRATPKTPSITSSSTTAYASRTGRESTSSSTTTTCSASATCLIACTTATSCPWATAALNAPACAKSTAATCATTAPSTMPRPARLPRSSSTTKSTARTSTVTSGSTT